MLRFLIGQGYKDRETQSVISEALGVIYDAKNQNGAGEEDKKEELEKPDNIEGKDEDTN